MKKTFWVCTALGVTGMAYVPALWDLLGPWGGYTGTSLQWGAIGIQAYLAFKLKGEVI